MAKTVVAVEITEVSVRAAEVTTGRSPILLAAGEVPLPPGAAKDSVVLDREAVALALSQLWSESGISGRNVTLGVGSRRVLVREHSTPLRNHAQIRQALPFQVQDLLPVPVDQAVLDFCPIHDDGTQVHGLLVAAVAETIEELIATLAQAKLHVNTVDLGAFGFARALGLIAPPGSTALLINIGEHTTQLVITIDGVPQFVRVMSVDIMPERDESAGFEAMPPIETESRRSRRRDRTVEAVAAPEEAPLTPEQQAALVDLAGRLRSTLSFDLAREDSLPIDVAWVSGAGSRFERMREVLDRIVGVEVRPLSATDVTRAKNPIEPALGARLLGAAALTLGGVR
jgi:type IV pilus assembly protein PilM